jgi:hypothetical protein
MKKNIITILMAICGQMAIAQVGINTQQPTASLHIKSDKEYIFTLLDNDHREDMYVLTADGNLGDIVKRSTNIFKNLKFATLGTLNRGDALIPASVDYQPKYVGDWYQIIGASIELPYGKWAVNITSLMTMDPVNLNIVKNTAITAEIMMMDYIIADPNNLVPSKDTEGNTKDSKNGNGYVSGTLVFPSQKEIVKGIIIINNDDPQRKARTYRFAARVTVQTESPEAFNLVRPKVLRGILNNNYSQTQVYAIPLN